MTVKIKLVIFVLSFGIGVFWIVGLPLDSFLEFDLPNAIGVSTNFGYFALIITAVCFAIVVSCFSWSPLNYLIKKSKGLLALALLPVAIFLIWILLAAIMYSINGSFKDPHAAVVLYSLWVALWISPATSLLFSGLLSKKYET